jgi:hypothetical protein
MDNKFGGKEEKKKKTGVFFQLCEVGEQAILHKEDLRLYPLLTRVQGPIS